MSASITVTVTSGEVPDDAELMTYNEAFVEVEDGAQPAGVEFDLFEGSVTGAWSPRSSLGRTPRLGWISYEGGQ